MEKIESNDYVDISPHKDKMILYKTISNKDLDNSNTDLPKIGDICEIFYTGYLEDNKIFDSNENTEIKKVFKVELGRNLVIKGWEILLPSIKKGERVKCLIDSSYAYGKHGFSKHKIPTNAKLIYEITLEDFYPKNSLVNSKKLKEIGVEYFKIKNYDNAVFNFKNALEIIDKNKLDKIDPNKEEKPKVTDPEAVKPVEQKQEPSEVKDNSEPKEEFSPEKLQEILAKHSKSNKAENEEDSEGNKKNKKDEKKDDGPDLSNIKIDVLEFKLTLLLNLGNCYYKQNKFANSIAILNEYINFNKKNPKAFYFKGLSFCNLCYESDFMNNYGEAKRDYYRLAELVPANEPGVIELREKLAELDDIISKNKNKDKQEEYTYVNKKNFKLAKGLYDDIPIVDKPIEIPKTVNPYNVQVFFDIKVGNNEPFRLEFELFNNFVPKTVENFRVLCTGEKEGQEGFENFTYVGTKFHRVIKDFMMQGGDFEKGDGTGGYSLYGREFEDENFKLNHSTAGVLSMANIGPNTNNSQFLITFSPCSWLNGKHVVFGRVIKGLEYLKKIENEVPTDKNDTPLEPIEIVSAGENFLK